MRFKPEKSRKKVGITLIDGLVDKHNQVVGYLIKINSYESRREIYINNGRNGLWESNN